MIQPRLLIPLSGGKQVLDAILLAVLFKQMLQIVEALIVFFGESVSGPVKIGDIALDQNIANERSGTIFFKKSIHGSEQLRAFLSHRPGCSARFAKHQVLAHGKIGKHAIP